MTNLVGLGDDEDADDLSRKDLTEEESFALLMGSVSMRDDDGQKPEELSKEKEENQQAIELQAKSKIAPGTAVARSKGAVPEEDIKPPEATQEPKEETVVDSKKTEDEELSAEVNEEPKKNKIQRMLSAPITFVGVGEADDDTGDVNALDDPDLLLKDMDMGFSLDVGPESVTAVEKSLEPAEKQVSVPALVQQPQPVKKEKPVEEDMKIKPQPVKKVAQKPVEQMKYDPVEELSRLERSMSSREEPSYEEVHQKGRKKNRSKGATKPLMLRGDSAVLFDTDDVDDDKNGLNAPTKPEQSYRQSNLYYDSESDEEPQLDNLYNGGDIYRNRMANIQENEAPKTKQMIINEIVSSRGSFRQHYLDEIVEQIEGSGKSIAEKLFTVNFLKDHGKLLKLF